MFTLKYQTTNKHLNIHTEAASTWAEVLEKCNEIALNKQSALSPKKSLITIYAAGECFTPAAVYFSNRLYQSIEPEYSCPNCDTRGPIELFTSVSA